MQERELDAPKVEARAKSRGFKIDRSYVNKILAGEAGHLTVPKLQAVAAGLDVEEDELFAVVRGLSEPAGFRESSFWKLFLAYTRIEKPSHKKLIDDDVAGLIRIIEALPKKKADGLQALGAIRKSR